MPILSPFPPNPDYGTGIFRRGVRLTNFAGEAIGELEDTMHGFRCRISHDGERILAVTAETPRIPISTCVDAGIPLQELVGMRLDTPLSHFYGEGRPRRNCTHLFDLAWWTIAQANRPEEGTRLYEVIIPDQPERDVPVMANLLRNGASVLEWQVADGRILAPEPFSGQPILRGFSGWAVQNLSGDRLEAALVMQKGYFVSGARRMQISAATGPIAESEAHMRGSCWTFSSPRMERAVRRDSFRDFTDGRDLLTFR